MTAEMPHDPQAVLDYSWDWADWLGADAIASHTVTVAAGDVVKDSDSRTATAVTAWLSGGTDGTRARVTCHITTAAGRQDDRTIYLAIKNR
mgnify:FL=1